MKVIISVGGRFHAVHLAEHLQKHDYLERIITTKQWYVKGVIDKSRYKIVRAPEYVGHAVRQFSFLRHKGYYSYYKDNLFDALARKYITACDVFHAWGNYALISLEIARRYHAKIVVERGSTHPLFQDAILKEEYARYGVQAEVPHPQIIEKGLEEMENADRVIIPSEFVRRTFVEAGFPNEKLVVAPYGFDARLFGKGEKKDSVFRVIFVGNIGIQKGVHYLLEAWKGLALPNAELVLIGRVEADFAPVLAKYEGTFTYRGHVKHEELQKEYHAASVFVLPSLQEGSALVTYEAMACGLPLIVTENTGSVVRDGADGLIIPIRDVRALQEAILCFHDEPGLSQTMGGNGAGFVTKFTWERYGDQVIDVYRSLLN